MGICASVLCMCAACIQACRSSEPGGGEGGILLHHSLPYFLETVPLIESKAPVSPGDCPVSAPQPWGYRYSQAYMLFHLGAGVYIQVLSAQQILLPSMLPPQPLITQFRAGVAGKNYRCHKTSQTSSSHKNKGSCHTDMSWLPSSFSLSLLGGTNK